VRRAGVFAVIWNRRGSRELDEEKCLEVVVHPGGAFNNLGRFMEVNDGTE
jgi:hypothetical protein